MATELQEYLRSCKEQADNARRVYLGIPAVESEPVDGEAQVTELSGQAEEMAQVVTQSGEAGGMQRLEQQVRKHEQLRAGINALSFYKHQIGYSNKRLAALNHLAAISVANGVADILYTEGGN